MKIRSRPLPKQGLIQDDDELALIAAMLWHTRLGSHTAAGRAAYRLLDRLEQDYDDDTVQEMADGVGLRVTIEEDGIERTFDSEQITLEV